jgi:hypothetical protein
MDFLVVVVVVVLFVLGLLVVVSGFSDRGRTPSGTDLPTFQVGNWMIRDPFRRPDPAGSRHPSQIAVGVALMLLAVVIAIVAI